jgi:dipeptidyl aminopeptidase/acylaminoacyl peptidase
MGAESAVRTYQDLLKNDFDKKLFEYYATSQMVKINLAGEQYPIGTPAIFRHISVSPDYRFLLVKMIQKPFSLTVAYSGFPFKVEIWDNDGNLFREVFDIPLAENIPKGFGAVRKGPRDINWRSDKPSTLYWVKALDRGNPKREVVIRDRLFLFDFPFDNKGIESVTFKNRYGGVKWGKGDFAVCYEWWWDTRTETVSSFNPDIDDARKIKLFEYNWQDEYNHPGDFITEENESGKTVLKFAEKGSKLYLKGKGATSEGYKPFIDKYEISTGDKERLWQSNNPYYEYPFSFINANKELILTRRESKTDPPNYFSRNLKNGVVSQITNYENPYPQLAEMRKEFVKYKRNDGVLLTGNLYTPPGYSVGDGMLPVLMWAYPNEYKSAATASQVKDSPNKFVRIGWGSPIFWVMRGYAVLDNPAMPIIGEVTQEANDTFIEQLVANATAAVQCIDSMGIADINKIAIGGHGYGAFMTANLLAHTDLFAAGIARSGAYNRTLTPFGFQTEQRTFWEAQNAYIDMSPFSNAHKINEPLLLIHGEADNNSGTFPIQSERMFAALKGNGGKVRLVMLPNESHEYKAKESIYHMLWEMDTWLENNLKQKEK